MTSTVLFLQFMPLPGKSDLKWAPTLFRRLKAERVMRIEVVIMFLSSNTLRSGPLSFIVVFICWS